MSELRHSNLRYGKPTFGIDGNMFYLLWGENIQVGHAFFARTLGEMREYKIKETGTPLRTGNLNVDFRAKGSVTPEMFDKIKKRSDMKDKPKESSLMVGKTERGFGCIEFADSNDVMCSLQKSSTATEDNIWLGINDPNPQILASKIMKGGKGWVKFPIPDDVLISTRMHLTQEQVKELLPILQKFVETGEIE